MVDVAASNEAFSCGNDRRAENSADVRAWQGFVVPCIPPYWPPAHLPEHRAGGIFSPDFWWKLKLGDRNDDTYNS